MIPTFIVVGHSAGGKSRLLSHAFEEFQNYGLFPEVITDRILLSRAVVEDQALGYKEKEVAPGKIARVSQHAILYRDHVDPGLRVFTVRDGVLLNGVHRQMAEIVASYNDPRGLLSEWTTGPNVPRLPVLPTEDEGLIQDGESIVRLLNQVGISGGRRILMVTVNADLEYRIMRNDRRPDAMDRDDFAKIFPDGGEMTPELAPRLPTAIKYRNYANGYDDELKFLREIRQLCRDEVGRLIEGRYGHPEK